MEQYTIVFAKEEDVLILLPLVNSAYREKDAGGWTTEAHLLEGTRTDAKTLVELIKAANNVILKALDAKGDLAGCVHLQQQNSEVYLGMLSVWPYLQNKGIGGYLLQASQLWALQQQDTSIIITVLSVRAELIAWYEQKGFVKTGAKKPFPDDPRFGSPKEILEFIELKKIVKASV